METQDLNLKRQIFSKDSLKGELVTKVADKFYLTGTSSGQPLRGLCFTDYLGEEYVFYTQNSRAIRRYKLLEKGVVTSMASLTDGVVSASLTQTISSVTYQPSLIIPALEIGKIYFACNVADVLMEFDYDFITHTFTFVQLITITQGAVVTDWGYINNGNYLVVYRQNLTIRYYPLSIPYDITTRGTHTQNSTSINVACRPYFFNDGKNAYYYQFVISSGQFDFCVASLSTHYRFETAVKRYGIAFNRLTWQSSFRPYPFPFALNQERSIISIPMNSGEGSTMSHGVFTVNGKFNKFLDVTIIT